MRIAACQFSISDNILCNVSTIENALIEAEKEKVKLVIFPECCLTGYPPRDIANAADIDFSLVNEACNRLQEKSNELRISFLIGTAYKENGCIYNRAILFQPNKMQPFYDKRALWGWDRDNFSEGNKRGIFEFDGIRIGVRICFEVRFPEYFRELYHEKTDLNIIMFYDVSDEDDLNRYNMIKGHIQTRAVENVCTIITANVISPFQTAPTAVFGPSGQIYAECSRNDIDCMMFDFEKHSLDFGERGRRELSDLLVKKH